MIRCRKHLFILVIASAIFAVFPLGCMAADALSFEGGESSGPAPHAPTLVSPGEDIITGKVKPKITGLTASGTAVFIYIDGIFNGQTEALIHVSGTANFSYVPFLNLSVGPHKVWAVAKDRNGGKSNISNVLNFNIERPFPAPIIFKPAVNKNTAYNKPYIIGLAKNNSRVQVFIDKKFYDEFKVKNNESGTANFAYLTPAPLTEGRHMVYTIAIDARGKKSPWSNIQYFNVSKPRQPKISAVAATDTVKNEELANNGVLEPFKKEVGVIKYSETGIINNKSSETANKTEKHTPTPQAPTSTGGIEELTRLEHLDREKINNYNQTGLINESAENQGKLKINLIIFLFFLLAVIGWIFWVNRELIREKRMEVAGESEKDNIFDS